MFAKIPETDATNQSLFITLTYGTKWPLTAVEWHDDLRKFCQKLERKHPNVAIIWRLEFQERGAPHYHLMALNCPFLPAEWVTKAWAEIAHVDEKYRGRYATNVQRPVCWEQACAYLAKYLAKPSDMALYGKSGRWWGVRGRKSLPMSLLERELTAEQFQSIKEWLFTMLPGEAISIYCRTLPIGLWSMLPPSVVTKLLDVAVPGSELGQEYIQLAGV